jgi:hypothetical protein
MEITLLIMGGIMGKNRLFWEQTRIVGLWHKFHMGDELIFEVFST